MSQDASSSVSIAKRKPGRPPSEAARQAILNTAYRILMQEGLGRLTIERVALEAGVGKPTIYRSWTNAQELAMAAFLSRPEAQTVEPAAKSKRRKMGTSSARAALKSHLASVIRAFATNRGRQITLTMASADPESELAKAFRSQIILKGREVGRRLLELAVASGEIRLNGNMEAVLDMVYGPLYFRLLVGHLALTDDFSNQLVDTVFDGVGSASPLRAS
jgi:AcrR family transcriptional regulator